MCSADAFAMNPQDAFPGGIPLPNFATPNFIESRFAEMDTLLQQTRSLFSHLEMRISHIEGRLQAVENMFQVEQEEPPATFTSSKIIPITRVHPYRVALVGSVFISAVLVASVLHSRDSRVHARAVTAQAATSVPILPAPSRQVTAVQPQPIRESKTASLPIVSHVTAREPVAAAAAHTSPADTDVPPAVASPVAPAAESVPASSVEVSDDKIHVVVRGDSLTSIARDHGVPVSQLMAANPMGNPNMLRVGMKLHIPFRPTQPQRVVPVEASYVQQAVQPAAEAPAHKQVRLAHRRIRLAGRHNRVVYKLVHLVQPGDTFYRLSIRYGVPLQTLIKTNPGLNPRRLLIAQHMRIPNGRAAAAAAVVPASAAPVPSQQPSPSHHATGHRATSTASVPVPVAVPLPTPASFGAASNGDGFTTEVTR